MQNISGGGQAGGRILLFEIFIMTNIRRSTTDTWNHNVHDLGGEIRQSVIPVGGYVAEERNTVWKEAECQAEIEVTNLRLEFVAQDEVVHSCLCAACVVEHQGYVVNRVHSREGSTSHRE